MSADVLVCREMTAECSEMSRSLSTNIRRWFEMAQDVQDLLRRSDVRTPGLSQDATPLMSRLHLQCCSLAGHRAGNPAPTRRQPIAPDARVVPGSVSSCIRAGQGRMVRLSCRGGGRGSRGGGMRLPPGELYQKKKKKQARIEIFANDSCFENVLQKMFHPVFPDIWFARTLLRSCYLFDIHGRLGYKKYWKIFQVFFLTKKVHFWCSRKTASTSQNWVQLTVESWVDSNQMFPAWVISWFKSKF